MRRKTHSILTAVSVLTLLFLTVENAGAAHQRAPKAKWTLMVYMAGDNNLEPYITSDIANELASAGSNADVQIVALADRIPGYDARVGDWTGTLIFHVTKNMQPTLNNAAVNLGEKDTADTQTLIDFVSWARTNYPADRYALVFWGHGWSWRPGFTMLDDTSNDTLDPHELAEAIPSLGFVDVVAYDGCNMGAIETEVLWRGHAQAISHSEEFVGADGLEYETVIPALQADPQIGADELAALFSQSAQGNKEKTWSAVALHGRWDNLEKAVDEWAVALNNGLPANRKTYDQAFNQARSFFQDPAARDLYDAAFEIKSQVKDSVIQAKSQAVMEAVNVAILSEWHVNAYADVHGITIYLPTKKSQLDYRSTPGKDFEYYRTNLGFAHETHWDEFLAAYIDQ